MIFSTLMAIALAQLPASPDPRPIPVAGIVVDGAGRPATDVDVWLAQALDPDEGHRFGMELWWSTLTRSSEGTARVLVHARPDADGRFTIDIPAEAVARRSPVPMAIWAKSSGKDTRVAWHRLPRIVLADDPPVRIELGPAAQAEVVVLGPDGKPVAGARVVPIRAGEVPIPEPMSQSLAATSEANGRAAIAGLSPMTLEAVRVEAPRFGTQAIQIPHPENGSPDSGNPKGGIPNSQAGGIVVTLAPVGRVAGRLVVPGDEPIRGVTVRATSQVGGYAGSGQTGSATVACDPQGRFEIPAIAAGMLAIELEFDRRQGTSLRGEEPRKRVVRAGRTTDVTIPMRETVGVHGLIREKGSDRPVPGVKVILNGYLGGDRFAVTDAAGTYAGRIARELIQPYGWPVRIPAPFFQPANMTFPRQGMPQRGVVEAELSPMVLVRGVDVNGAVVGEDGKPAAAAEVEAFWDDGRQVVRTRADRTGAFTFHGVDPLAELHLTAWDGFASTPEVTARAEAAAARPIALTISPKNATPIGGRVVDADGKPIAGASVRIRRQVRTKVGRAIIVEPIAAEDGSVVLRTDAEGRYRTRRRFPARASYQVEASAPGRLASRSPAIDAAGPVDKPPILVLRRVRTVEGRVLDRRGQPVVGAVVRQSGDGPMPTEALTADDGRFRLSGVLEGPALVFAEKPGYRFGFRPIDDGPRPVEVVLARVDEPPAVAYRTLPPALPIEEEKALARRLILAPAENILRNGKELERFRFFRDAADIDPLAMLERLESLKLANADYLKLLRVNLAGSLARENLDEATAMLEASDSADVRAGGYLGICDARRDLRPDQARELLIQADVNAKGMKYLMFRIPIEAQIADHWLDLGETDRARAALDDALALARGSAKGNRNVDYNLGRIAEVLARLDLPAALKLIDDLERDVRKNEKVDRSLVFQQFLGHIAYKLADRSPADAERVLERIPVEQRANRYVIAVCSRMAAKDLPRARRIAGSRFSSDAPGCRPHAFGLMARAIADTDRPAAIRLIDEAFSALDTLADDGSQATYSGVEVGAGLLPVVEQVEPDRLAEFLGRALTLRPARGGQTDRDEDDVATTTAALAMMVARYDRALAARLLQPELHHIGNHPGLYNVDYTTWRVLSALALIDPKRAVECVEALPDDLAPGTDPDATKNHARTYVARLLAFHDAERWRFIYEYFLNLWTPDQPYL
ncbi:MAG: carboxypeptidase regulatory-like domain-containing protein [Isosphaeraceae bacterium]